MIGNFLRRPRRAGEYAADAVRAIGVLSVVVAGLGWSATDMGILAFALPALMLPRFVGVRSWFDVTAGVVVLSAAWSNVLHLYTTVPGWDLLMHVVCTWALAALCYLALAHARVVPVPRRGSRRRTPLVVVPALALAISALWEMVEWFGDAFLSDEIFVAYADTIGDMAAGGVGGAAAGLLVALAPILRDDAVGLGVVGLRCADPGSDPPTRASDASSARG